MLIFPSVFSIHLETINQFLKQLEIKGDVKKGRNEPDEGDIKIERVKLLSCKVLGGYIKIRSKIQWISGAVVIKIDGRNFLD